MQGCHKTMTINILYTMRSLSSAKHMKYKKGKGQTSLGLVLSSPMCLCATSTGYYPNTTSKCVCVFVCASSCMSVYNCGYGYNMYMCVYENMCMNVHVCVLTASLTKVFHD